MGKVSFSISKAQLIPHYYNLSRDINKCVLTIIVYGDWYLWLPYVSRMEAVDIVATPVELFVLLLYVELAFIVCLLLQTFADCPYIGTYLTHFI